MLGASHSSLRRARSSQCVCMRINRESDCVRARVRTCVSVCLCYCSVCTRLAVKTLYFFLRACALARCLSIARKQRPPLRVWSALGLGPTVCCLQALKSEIGSASAEGGGRGCQRNCLELKAKGKKILRWKIGNRVAWGF